MHHHLKKPVLFLLSSLAILWGSASIAGDCRGLLRPLLLQQAPDAGELQSVREICQREANDGDPAAEYQLSLFYLGLIDWNVDKALPLIMNAAQSGVPEAQYWLAWQYDAGPLLPDDIALARRWYEQAGENDHRLALQRLADAYQNGDLGLTVDARKASVLRARASRCENKSS
jgi:TPR repeat protein